jgi:4-hydroxy-tetrahydrodipicolinate synthase
MAKQKEPVLAAGVYAALLTPRRPGSIEPDTAVVLEYLDTIVQAGVDGLVLFGSTGEFVHFDTEERIRVVSMAIRRSRVPILVNVSHSTLTGAVRLAEGAIDAGASGLLLMPPYFYSYSDDQIYEFYDEFVRLLEKQVPLYLYNLPMFTNPISTPLAERLLQTGAFDGIKDSSGDATFFERMAVLKTRVGFQLLVGTESTYTAGLRGGADGIVSGVAAAIPELLVALTKAFFGGNGGLAETLNQRLTEFLAYVDQFPATIAIKEAAVVRGWNLSQLAVPVDEDLAAEIISFQNWFRNWIPGVLAECGELAPVRT